jgi:hypothetical protein
VSSTFCDLAKNLSDSLVGLPMPMVIVFLPFTTSRMIARYLSPLLASPVDPSAYHEEVFNQANLELADKIFDHSTSLTVPRAQRRL